MDLMLYDTFTNSKKKFEPIDPNNVRMYVCGPTVYDYAHVGNARPVIVFDILFRLLQKIYGSENVTYVRNITDIEWDDIAESAPAIVAMITMPLTYSISNGIALAFVAYALIKILIMIFSSNVELSKTSAS